MHAGFTLADAARLVPYLARLGISHVYSSPLLKARAGSQHGYDVVDPTLACPERGGENGLAALAATLHAHDMGLILDIVPNHMGIGAENPWWDDLLTHGRASAHAAWFDIDWESGAGRVVLPILGAPLPDVVADGAIRIRWDPARGIRLRYFEHDLPIDPATAAGFVARAARRPGGAALAGRAPALRALPLRRPDAPGRAAATERALAALAEALTADPSARQAIDAEAAALADPSGRDRLRSLLDAQAYRLVHWRRVGRLVNYRRFFNIADLAGVRVEDDDVFAAMHARILEWVAAGHVDGLRVDHVDGLWDPRRYLDRLRDATARARPDRPTPIWVEKILCGDERLRNSWPVAGTTGYEVAKRLDTVLIDAAGAARIETWYRRGTVGGPRRLELATIVDGAKRRVLGTWLAADLRRIVRALLPLVDAAGGPPDATPRDIERALVETIVGLPVYRTYLSPAGAAPDAEDRRLVAAAAERARRNGRARADLVDAIARLLAADVPVEAGDPARRGAAAVQQLSSAAMAKGVEDTALYAFVPLASRNEVGGDPAEPLTDAVARLHAANAERAARWPDTLVTVSTHDTKRSADVRARLDVLSEIAADWCRIAARWRRRNRRHRMRVGRRLLPDDNTEYLLYQSMLGLWPVEGDGPPALATLRDRLAAYSVKAVREAKVHTSWLAPDEDFEAALLGFLDALLADDGFRSELEATAGRIAPAGRWNALARTLVQLTVPGVPDVYQGDELWTLALADPDNRRAVDYALRDRMLARLEGGVCAAELLADPDDGALKLHVVRTALAARRRAPATFARGAYEPLAASGARADHLLAFARRHEGDVAVTVVPRLVHGLAGGAAPVGTAVWRDTVLALPGLGGRTLYDRLTGARHPIPTSERVAVHDLLTSVPVCLLTGGDA